MGGRKRKREIKDWIKALIIALVILLLCKAFIIDIHVVQNTYMNSTLRQGDYVLVNKLKHGARFPITPLSLPFSNKYLDWLKLPYFRLPGFADIERGELLAINYPKISDLPIDRKEVYVKRCVALPADTLNIFFKEVYINGKKTEIPPSIQYDYRIITKETSINDSIINKYRLYDGGRVSSLGIYDYALTNEMADSLLKEDYTDTVRINKKWPGEGEVGVFPMSPYFAWNLDHFGLIVIPGEGITVHVSKKNIDLYKRIIDVYEDNKLDIQQDRIFINNVETNSYTFKQNYYFVLDDNRDYSKDSRKWGFLPEDHIVGSVSRIIFSIDAEYDNAICWNRILRKAD